ncbi:MAG: hypothetical protein IPK07_35595 [Deltaproteobacteria bacterium]|nr:hypothetical protein [Deltaproteobacteria bacterium]
MVFTPRLDRIRLFGGGYRPPGLGPHDQERFAYIQGRRFNYDISSDTLFTNSWTSSTSSRWSSGSFPPNEQYFQPDAAIPDPDLGRARHREPRPAVET